MFQYAREHPFLELRKCRITASKRMFMVYLRNGGNYFLPG
jgi:hypothetical protein